MSGAPKCGARTRRGGKCKLKATVLVNDDWWCWRHYRRGVPVDPRLTEISVRAFADDRTYTEAFRP